MKSLRFPKPPVRRLDKAAGIAARNSRTAAAPIIAWARTRAGTLAGAWAGALAGGFIAVVLTSCAAPDHLSEDFGRSVEAISRVQRAFPDAPLPPPPPGGTAGAVVESTYAKYKARFE